MDGMTTYGFSVPCTPCATDHASAREQELILEALAMLEIHVERCPFYRDQVCEICETWKQIKALAMKVWR